MKPQKFSKKTRWVSRLFSLLAVVLLFAAVISRPDLTSMQGMQQVEASTKLDATAPQHTTQQAPSIHKVLGIDQPACSNMTLVIDCDDFIWQPSGFLGNNIIALLSAVLEAADRNLDLTLKSCNHELLNTQALASTLPNCPASNMYFDNKHIGFFFTFYKASWRGMDVGYWEGAGETEEWRFPRLAPCIYKPFTTALFRDRIVEIEEDIDFENSIIIHIRAGDVNSASVKGVYGPPPLSFFIDAIERNPDKTPIIVTNDKGGFSNGEVSMGSSEVTKTWVEYIKGSHPSPVVDALLAKFPQARVVSGSLEHDVSVLLQAKHLVASQGTFAYAIALGSEALESFYYFGSGGQRMDLIFTDVDLHLYTTDGYFVKWENSEEQVKEMLEYPREKLAYQVVRRSAEDCLYAPRKLLT